MLNKFASIFNRLDEKSGGWLSVFQKSAARFHEMRGPELSASLAYYALFSLFPLTIFLVVLSGYFLGTEGASTRTITLIRLLFPFSDDLIARNLEEVQEKSAALGLVGLLGLLWAGSGFFSTFIRSINRAWPSVKLRSMVHTRLFAFGMIGVMLLLLVASLVTSLVLGLLPSLQYYLSIAGFPTGSSDMGAGFRLIPPLFTFLLFISIYRWVPNKAVKWSAVFTGALIVTIVWELAKMAFGLYLKLGIARFEYIYGSLESLIFLMLWIYVSNLITTYGAFLVATIDIRSEELEKQNQVDHAKDLGLPKGIRG